MKNAGARSYPVFSVEKYLEYERFAQEKHEFLGGGVYATAGESPRHSTICFNLYGIVHAQLRGKKMSRFFAEYEGGDK